MGYCQGLACFPGVPRRVILRQSSRALASATGFWTFFTDQSVILNPGFDSDSFLQNYIDKYQYMYDDAVKARGCQG